VQPLKPLQPVSQSLGRVVPAPRLNNDDKTSERRTIDFITAARDTHPGSLSVAGFHHLDSVSRFYLLPSR